MHLVPHMTTLYIITLLQAQGLDDVDMVKEADEDDMKQAVDDVCSEKPFHRSRILKEYRKLASANANAHGGAMAAAAPTHVLPAVGL